MLFYNDDFQSQIVYGRLDRIRKTDRYRYRL